MIVRMNVEETRQAAIALERKYHEALFQLQNDQEETFNNVQTIDNIERRLLGINNNGTSDVISSSSDCVVPVVPKSVSDSGNHDVAIGCSSEGHEIDSKNKLGQLDAKRLDLLKKTMQELISTELDYLESLHFLHKNFLKPIHEHITKAEDRVISQRAYNTLRIICRFSKEFLTDLPTDIEQISSIGAAFQNNKVLFNYYAKLSENWTAYMRIIERPDIQATIKKHENDINEPLGFSRYILKPIQRISKYELLLNNMQKQLEPDGEAAIAVAEAVAYVHKVLNRCNSLVALKSIEYNHFDEQRSGNFILRTHVKRLKRSRRRNQELLTEEGEFFIFEKVLIFAIEINDELHYRGAILMKDLRMVDEPHPLRFTLEDFRKFKKTGFMPRMELQANNASAKQKCVEAIGKVLWNELEKLKQLASASNIITKPRQGKQTREVK